MTSILLLFFLLAVGLAAPTRATSHGRWLIASLICFAGIVVPLVLFALNPLALPEWKGAARCGWVDGFHKGELALTPVVLFAAAALYRLEVIGAAGRARWVILGLYCGAVSSVIFQIFAFTCLDIRGFWPATLVVLMLYIPSGTVCVPLSWGADGIFLS